MCRALSRGPRRFATLVSPPVSPLAHQKIFKLAVSVNPIGGERSVRVTQRTITVQAYKMLVQQRRMEGALPSDDEAAVLGVKPEIAAEILEEMEGGQGIDRDLRPPESSALDPRSKEDIEAARQKEIDDLKARVQADEGDDFEMKDDPFADDDSGAGAQDESPGKVVECGECGFTLLIAKGREFKFFGKNFKCPECGAAKSKFTEIDADGDEGLSSIRTF